MYNVHNNTVYIDGNNGIYRGKIIDPNVLYARNATDNYIKYLLGYNPDLSKFQPLTQDRFQKKKSEMLATNNVATQTPPLNFRLQYCPNGFNPYSLLAASYEEMGTVQADKNAFTISEYIRNKDKENAFLKSQGIDPTKQQLSTEEICKKYSAINQANATNPEILGDKITLSSEVLDLNNDGKIDLAEYSTLTLVEDQLSDGKVDGVITNNGSNQTYAFQLPQNKAVAQQTLRNYYVAYNLGLAQKQFMQNPNNMAD